MFIPASSSSPSPWSGAAMAAASLAARTVEKRAEGFFRQPVSMGDLMSGVVWFMTALALAFLILRIYSKYLRGKGFWWDDYILGAAWNMLLLSSICMSVMVRFDYGRHSRDIPPEHMSPILFLMVLQGFFSILAAAWSKTSFAVTLLRLADSSPGRWNTACLWGIIVSVNLVLGAAAVITWAQCNPVELNWGPLAERRSHCLGGKMVVGLMQGSAVYSGLADLALAAMPWAMLWKANMSNRNKYSVLLAMSMSIFAGTASFIKASALPSLITGDMMDGTQLLILTAAEIAVTIMASSIPVMRTLWVRADDMTHRSSRSEVRPMPPSLPPAPRAAEVAASPSAYPRMSRDVDTVEKMDSFSSSSTVNLPKDGSVPNRTLC